ncbi:MAG: hypothetical protein HDT25_02240 [Ruminococcus sp.]|nr:hypothetical protein [Ruminococcus sp.]
MRFFVRLVLGLLLIYAGFSRQDIFYRIRGISLKGAGIFVMRIIYIFAGILLIVL